MTLTVCDALAEAVLMTSGMLQCMTLWLTVTVLMTSGMLQCVTLADCHCTDDFWNATVYDTLAD